MPLGQNINAANGNDACPVKDEPNGLMPLLLSISKASRLLISIKLAEIDLHIGQDELLLALGDAEAVAVSTLAERLLVRPSTVSKIADKMVDRRLVRRVADSTDTRRTLIELTAHGRNQKEKVKYLRAELEIALFGKVSHESLDWMDSALRFVDKTMQQRLARLR